jgi:hypothetical protein
MAVNRDLPNFILKILLNFLRIRLDSDADSEINNDIYRFIENKVDEFSAWRYYSELLRIYMNDIFLNRAKGIFL